MWGVAGHCFIATCSFQNVGDDRILIIRLCSIGTWCTCPTLMRFVSFPGWIKSITLLPHAMSSCFDPHVLCFFLPLRAVPVGHYHLPFWSSFTFDLFCLFGILNSLFRFKSHHCLRRLLSVINKWTSCDHSAINVWCSVTTGLSTLKQSA